MIIGKELFLVLVLASSTIAFRKKLPHSKVQSKKSSTAIVEVPRTPQIANFIVIILQMYNVSFTAKDIIPSQLTGFDENKKNKPYITGVIAAKESDGYFTIGDGKNYSYRSTNSRHSIRSLGKYVNVYNAPLEKGVNYFYLVRAHVNESEYYSTDWIELVVVNETGDQNHFMYIGVAVGAAIFIIMTVFFVHRVLQRDKNRRINVVKLTNLVIGNDNFDKDDPTEEVEEDVHKIPPNKVEEDVHKIPPNKVEEDVHKIPPNEVEEDVHKIPPNKVEEDVHKIPPNKVEEDVHKIPPNEMVVDERYPVIKVDRFKKTWESLKKNSYQKLSEEFMDLSISQLYDWSEAGHPELKAKNRYDNILTYNHSRVKLLSTSNYINASFVHGYTEKNMYIATQGPSSKTFNDFWCMVWDYNVSIIVVVTNLIERNRVKCDKYWPDQSSLMYGEIEVGYFTQETYADFVIRTFSIKKENITRTVKQYHYLSWPDHGVPEYSSNLLNFRHKIRKNHPVNVNDSPIVVHCSAGVGRTGTFIAIDNLLKLASEKDEVDVFNFVNFMRTRRIQMVQTEEQYVFIYNALYEALICGFTEITLTMYEIKQKDLIKKDRNTTKRNIDKQFDTLNFVTPKLTQEETSASITKENKNKNRAKIYARNMSRVILSFGVDREEILGDYINAVYVNGYKRKDAFIATQHPLKNTVADFWRMVYEKNLPVVVMLHGFKEDDQNFQKICPNQSESISYRPIIVQFQSEKLENGFQIRDIIIKNSHKNGQSEACVIACDKWMKDKAPVGKDLISLFKLVDKKMGVKKKSVVVVCSDGANQCGTYIAASILLEQVQMEQSVDVFQTVRKIRLSRPEFVPNMEQYEFLYRLIREYLDSFESYSNFKG